MNSHEHRIKRRHRKPGALVVQLLEATGHVRHSQEVELRHETEKITQQDIVSARVFIRLKEQGRTEHTDSKREEEGTRFGIASRASDP